MTAVSDEAQVRYAATNGWSYERTTCKTSSKIHVRFRTINQSHGGIITVPFTAIPERLAIRCAMMLDWIDSEASNPHNQLFRWTDLQQQLNSGYVLDGYTAEEIALALGRTP